MSRYHICRSGWMLIAALALMVQSSACASSNRYIELTIVQEHGEVKMSVEKNASELRFYKSGPMRDVQGIERLSKLKTVILDMPQGAVNLDFLGNNPSIERVVLVFCKDFNPAFLLRLPNLNALYLRNMNLEGVSFDFANNPVLEYVEITGCRLKKTPTFNNFPDSLKYLNLSSNEIQEITDNTLEKVERIFVNLNPNFHSSWPNIITSNPWDILPDKFRQASS